MKPIAIFVEDAADVAAFENFTAADVEGAAPAPAAEEPKKETKEESAAPAASAQSAKSEATTSHGGMSFLFHYISFWKQDS